jgi:hypothetical protein
MLRLERPKLSNYISYCPSLFRSIFTREQLPHLTQFHTNTKSRIILDLPLCLCLKQLLVSFFIYVEADGEYIQYHNHGP